MTRIKEQNQPYRFQDLVDIDSFDQILDDLYDSTRIPSAIIDIEPVGQIESNSDNESTDENQQAIKFDFTDRDED